MQLKQVQKKKQEKIQVCWDSNPNLCVTVAAALSQLS